MILREVDGLGGPARGSFSFLVSRGALEDHGPKVEVVSWTLVAISLIFLGLRLYCKFMRHRGLWWDDYILIASWLALAVECSCTTASVAKGFGKHINDVPPQNLESIGKVGNISGFLSFLAVMWSKTSFAVTLLRITDGWTKRFVWFVIISMNVTMGISALFIWVQCTPVEKSWKPYIEGTCMSSNIIVRYGIFSAVYSGVMDVTLSLLPWKLVWGLQMKLKEKVGVGLAMTMGIFAGGTAFVKASKIPTLTSGDFTYFGSELVIWSVAEAAATIMAASIPVLRALVVDLRTSTRKYYGSGQAGTPKSRTNHNTVIMASRNGPHKAASTKGDDGSDKSILTPGHGKILQTNEITLEYTDRNAADGDSMSYEMGKMGKRDGAHAM